MLRLLDGARHVVSGLADVGARLHRLRHSPGDDAGEQATLPFVAPGLQPPAGVLVFGEEDEPPIVPAPARSKIGFDPFGKPTGPRVGPMGVPLGQGEHLLHLGNVRDGCGKDSGCLGGLIVLSIDQCCAGSFLRGLVFDLDRALHEGQRRNHGGSVGRTV